MNTPPAQISPPPPARRRLAARRRRRQRPDGQSEVLTRPFPTPSHHTKSRGPATEVLTSPTPPHPNQPPHARPRSGHAFWLGISRAHEKLNAFQLWPPPPPRDFRGWAKREPRARKNCWTCLTAEKLPDGGDLPFRTGSRYKRWPLRASSHGFSERGCAPAPLPRLWAGPPRLPTPARATPPPPPPPPAWPRSINTVQWIRESFGPRQLRRRTHGGLGYARPSCPRASPPAISAFANLCYGLESGPAIVCCTALPRLRRNILQFSRFTFRPAVATGGTDWTSTPSRLDALLDRLGETSSTHQPIEHLAPCAPSPVVVVPPRDGHDDAYSCAPSGARANGTVRWASPDPSRCGVLFSKGTNFRSGWLGQGVYIHGSTVRVGLAVF